MKDILESSTIFLTQKTDDKVSEELFSATKLSSRLLIKASGQGDYWGEYEGVKCKVYFKANPYQKEDDDRTFLTVEQVKMDFSVKDITMGVENDNNNKLIRKFIRVIELVLVF